MTNDKKILSSLIIPFGMSPADEVETINAALQERGLDASNVVSVRATGTPEDGIIIYFRSLCFCPFPHKITSIAQSNDFCSLCNFEMPQYGGDPHCPKCMAFIAEKARVK